MTSCVTKISRSQDRGNVVLERSKVLKEVYDVVRPEIMETDDEVVEGIGRKEREEQIRLVREEVQGFLEHVASVIPNFRGLEKASTGILEPVASGRTEGCEYCGEGHRNGNCELPEASEIGLQ